MAKVILQNLQKKYAEHDVVRNVNLEIPDKEFFILVGPSGCGKSTTLRMIAGLEDISGGQVLINDRVVNNVAPKDRDIAMVFQNYALYPHMTVYENMSFGLKLKKIPKKEIDKRVNEAADILNIRELLQRKPKALSGGQRQRVAVGRAIVRKPQVFLFDEPLSNLDAKMRVQMRVELSRLHDQLQTTMIYVTHDQVEAMTMGDRICVMKDGEVQQVAPPLELYHKPVNQFVAGFIGNPPMNFMPVQVVLQVDSYWLLNESVNLRVPKKFDARMKALVGKTVTLGIRPEDIYDKLFYGTTVLPGTTVKANVDVVEPMGSEIYLYLKAGKQDVIARVPPQVQAHAGQKMEVVFNLEQLHLFDAESGLSLI
ncbi:MAG TPA: sn-glycerol-3-phosphate ABC transporter ATP-binding protein UgpC [Elusimicrobiota bacterium]|nr:sn-glycerol-3-phosphate ABC transporter ATP-binding protein UgpC [Elusimicrobiota bacterium]